MLALCFGSVAMTLDSHAMSFYIYLASSPTIWLQRSRVNEQRIGRRPMLLPHSCLSVHNATTQCIFSQTETPFLL